MAAHRQTRIQAYLEKNKIGPLFEELMTKLITETPDQPIPFLISHLQNKQGNHGQLQRTLSGSAALWAESDSPENRRKEFRNYDKPWQANAKKPKKSKSDLAVSNLSPPSPESKTLPRSLEHPKWDWRTKPESQDFDELNHILQESKKLGKALQNLSRSIAISDELEQDTRAFNSSLLRPCVIGEWMGREEDDADPLAAEMLQPPVPRNKNEQWESEEGSSSPAGSLKMEPKNKGLKQQQQHHKKLLAAMLSQDSFDSVNSTVPSVTEEDIHDEDDAMELLEDFDDLRMEGVTSLMPSGNKYSQGRNTYTGEPQAKVTLNICSRLQGDNLVEGAEDIPHESHSPERVVPDSADIEKDLALMTEARLSKSPSSHRSSLIVSDQQGNLQPSPRQNVRLQGPSQTGRNTQLQLQGDNLSTQANSRAQVSSISESKPWSPNTLINKYQTPFTQGSKPTTPNNLPSQPLTSSNHENKDTKIGIQRSRSATPKSQIRQAAFASPVVTIQIDAENTGNTSQRSSLIEDEYLQQLQVVRQPWIPPSDTESEGVEAEQKKCS
uniref:Uncharacterized protein C8orf34 homolog isoform X6 n=1 Tax=Geotrypetes seraphini TaxID=260995 RepID=A0A6P8QW98_GEOSA|nr:uncharacterized protein C8orf34 homolog isoform X6 [Geotrypetes seraphini]